MPRTSRALLSLGLVLVLGLPGFAAENAGKKEIADLQAAMGGNDAIAKRDAIKKLADRKIGSDAEVLPLLVAAVSDRQSADAAISALGSRSGKPAPRGGIMANGKDPEKVAAVWQAWLADVQAKQKTKELEKKMADLEKKKTKPGEADPAAAAHQEPAKADAKPEGQTEAPAPAPAEDLGKQDRIIFKSGGSMVCFIQSKRLDGEGNLLSLRVVHLDGGGEETLAADLISRIEEDIQ